MATSTAKLLLRKPDPDPITGDDVDVQADLNDNWDKIDDNIGAREVANAAARNALAAPFQNQFVRQTDNNSLWICVDPSPLTWVQVVIGGTTASTTDHIRVSRATTTGGAYLGRVDGDSDDRLIIDAQGRHVWGSGTGAQDTNLYRSAANTLKTDDDFVATGTVTCRSCNVGGHTIVTRSGTLSIPSGGGGTDVTWTAEARDIGAMWSSGTNLTLPYTGFYVAIANTSWALQAGGVRSLSIKQAGGIIAENKMTTTGQSEPQSVAVEFSGTAGQVITAACFQTSGSAINVSNTRLSVRLTGQ